MEHDCIGAFQFGLFKTEPPYDRWQDASVRGVSHSDPSTLREGSVLAIYVRTPDRSWPNLQTKVWQLRKANPAAPVVLLIDSVNAAHWARHFLRVGHCGIRAVLIHGEPIEPALRLQLVDVPDLGSSIIDWLGLMNVAPSVTIETLLRDIIGRADDFDSVETLLASRGWTWRKTSIALKAARLPGPGKWYSLSLGLRACLALQANPELSTHHYALLLGYDDSASIRRRITRLFRAQISDIRATIGWEWLMDRWWKSVRRL